MGDSIILTGLKIIQNGLFQIDFKNDNTGESFRAFVQPLEFFEKLGQSMQDNHYKWVNTPTTSIKEDK